MNRQAINDEVRALERLDLEGLRAEWMRRYGRPPKMRSVEILGLMLAWKIQSQAFGGLDVASKRRIRSGAMPRGLGSAVTPGTVISREFRGVTHQVIATEGGCFSWRGQTFSSLSAVALAMTGTKSSGQLFFGLKEKARVKG